jgi:4-amino-4-deoxy-L-arabinose transferase-like glycosyltransferase
MLRNWFSLFINGNRRTSLVIFGILISAIILRIWGIGFGLPNIYSTDEWFEVKRALKLGVGSYEFDRAGKGFFFYILFIEYAIYFVITKTLGNVRSGYDFLLLLFNDPTIFWLIGRATNAVIGSLNCYILYLLGKKLHSENVGLLAALVMAAHILHVNTSHYIDVDIPLVFLITICLLIMYSSSGTLRYGFPHYSILGAVCALAVTAKITGGVILFSVLAFHYGNIKLENRISTKSFFIDKRLVLFWLVFTVVLFLVEPGYLLRIKNIAVWVLSFFRLVNPDQGSSLKWPIYPRTPWAYYLSTLFPFKYWAISAAALIGLVLSLRIPRREILLAFLIPYLFFLFSSQSKELVFGRYLMPVLPILCIYSGLALERLLEISQTRLKYGLLVFIIALGFTVYPLIDDSVALDLGLSKPDTRTVAKIWVQDNIPVKSKIYIEGTGLTPSASTVPLRMDPDFIDESTRNEDGDSLKGEYYRAMKESLKNGPTYRLIMINNARQLSEALKYKTGDYVILNGAIIGKFRLKINQDSFPEIFQLLLWVDSEECRLIKVFQPDEVTEGPTILIYKRKV